MAVGGTRVLEHAPLGARTTYRVGGRARLLVTLSSLTDLDELGPLMLATGLPIVRARQRVEPARRGRRARGRWRCTSTTRSTALTWRDEDDVVVIEAGGGLDLPIAARRLANDGVVGFEWAVGVPGTFGGAVAMNAGGHGDDIAASMAEATSGATGETSNWSQGAPGLGYRTSALEAGRPRGVGAAASSSRGRGVRPRADP